MKTPKEFVLYNCGDKWFGTYNLAYFYSKKINKPVYYVHSVTMYKFRKVADFDRHHLNYVKNHFHCDYLDLIKRERIKQLDLLKGEIK